MQDFNSRILNAIEKITGNEHKITKELDQIDTTTLKDGFTVVVTSEGVRVFFKQGDKIERQPGLEIS